MLWALNNGKLVAHYAIVRLEGMKVIVKLGILRKGGGSISSTAKLDSSIEDYS